MDTFGELIRSLRTSRGFTIQEFAKKVGISRVTAHHFESGMTLPTRETLLNIVKALGLYEEETQRLFAAAGHKHEDERGRMTAASAPSRTKVFISYSHKDEKY